MPGRCLICGGHLGVKVLSLGMQPVTKNLIDHAHPESFHAALDVVICTVCATVQLADPWPHHALVPWHDWMSFREPEEHLDDVVERVIEAHSLEPDALILGISAKDDTTVSRFEKKGFKNTYRVQPDHDLRIKTQNAYIESVQHELSHQVAEGIVAEIGQVDCLIVRHILEHAERPDQFLDAISVMLKPGGVAVFEVPDCESALENNDYALIWEEHNIYFTEATLNRCLAKNGFENCWGIVYPYAFENSIVIAAQKASLEVNTSTKSLQKELSRFDHYAKSFKETKTRVTEAITSFVDDEYTIVLFGAGHLGCSFLNYNGIGDRLAFAVDDAPEKLGLKLPGTGLEIRPTSDLAGMSNLVCLLSVTPDKENAVVERLQAQLRSDVAYRSIVSTSPRYIGG